MYPLPEAIARPHAAARGRRRAQREGGPWALTALLLVSALAVAGCATIADTERVTVRLGDEAVFALVADTPGERREGLQGLDRLREGEGLLFLWPEEEAAWHAFEIAEVDYPIEVVFVGPDGRITAIESLDPGDARTVHGDGETDLAIELPQGWSVGNGVGPGDTVTIEGR